MASSQQAGMDNGVVRNQRRTWLHPMAYSLNSEEAADFPLNPERKYIWLDEDDEREAQRTKKIFVASCALILTFAAIYILLSRLLLGLRMDLDDPSSDDASLTRYGRFPGLGNQQTVGSVDALVHKNLSSIDFIQRSPCGESPAEAKARGCYFDMIEMLWLPLECYDPELEEELASIKRWRLYRNLNKTEVVTWAEAKTGQHDFLLSDWDFHTYHCVFRAYKFFRSVTGRGLSSISSNMAGWNHMKHCRDLSLDREIPIGTIKARFRNGFPDCGVVHW